MAPRKGPIWQNAPDPDELATKRRNGKRRESALMDTDGAPVPASRMRAAKNLPHAEPSIERRGDPGHGGVTGAPWGTRRRKATRRATAPPARAA
jgi:hypothetical protein